MQKEKEARKIKKISSEVSVEILELGTRVTNTLLDAKLATVADLLAILENGDQALLEIKGFGRKSLIDLKKALRAQNFEIPEAAKEITV
ncbi:MAG: DNA-directed RNA polymerase subunit alpha C-terminal domain-containing protein [Anaerolineales bacterium]